MISIKQRYKQSWLFIKESKNYILLIIFLFLLSALIGVIYPEFFKDQISAYLSNLFEKVKDYNFIQLFFFILKNNASSAFSSLILGLILGIFPIISMIMNGYVLGFVSGKSASIAGLPILLRLLPHGIFELPAVFISAGMGLRVGWSIFSRKSRKKFPIILKDALYSFLLIVIPLLIIAAVIETWLIIIGF